MKKFLYAVMLLMLLTASFLAGSFYHNRKAEKSNLSEIQPSAADSGKAPATDSDTDIDASFLPAGAVRIISEKQQLIGVRTGVVEKSAVTKTLRLLGRVAPDENSIFSVKAPVEGTILKIYPGTTGSMVKKQRPLATYYSPDIYAAKQAYLIALTSDRYRYSLQVPVNESKLAFLGMSASQIEELKKTGQIEETITLLSPGSGFIFSRAVSPGLRFQKGEELYRIVDLNRVWIFADVYEGDAQYFKPKVVAKVSNSQLGKELHAQVSDALPLFDDATRTLKVRLEVDNPDFLLRPDMFVDIELPIHFPPAITVPVDAVLDSGLKKTVFVDLGNGLLEPREVETGWRFDNLVEIAKGLDIGERIIISGTFLVDSESRMEMAAEGMKETMSKDPVSGLDVSINKAEKAGRKTIYKNKTYYFSSDECKIQFEKNPEGYQK
jgi:membrane fusion protein, copper/silver efflux system